MADVFRRVVLKPPAATPEHLAQLLHALAEAVETQRRLATQCPYILQPTGALDQDEHALYVAHEPATPLAPRELFDPDAPLIPPDQLFQAAVALLDALATAHRTGAGRAAVHGGLCPGVILHDADGLLKVADFGFAPAICKVLGVESYLNLAVGPQAAGTGVWEVLPRDVTDRDDRLCAFIDPDRYGQEALGSFEPGSDLIAAGFILRLLAEHKHAYLGHEPEAHRVVDMAQMMSFGVSIRLTRKDLRDATSPEIEAWREVVRAMLARVPGERPPAAELVRRLQAAAPQKADPGVLKAQRWVTQLETMLEAKAWSELQAALADRPPVREWPPELLARVTDVEKRVAEYAAEAGRRATAEAELKAAQRWLERLRVAVGAAQWEAAQTLLDEQPALEHWPEQVRRAREPLAAQVQQARAAEKARAWHKALQKAFQSKDWSAVGRRFAQRPAAEECPPDVRESAAAIEAAYHAYLQDEERQRRKIASEQSEVRGWLEHARRLTEKQQWMEAIDFLADAPQVEHWPEGARDEVDQLQETCRLHLGDVATARLDEVTASLQRQVDAALREVIAEKFAGLLRPEHLLATIEYVMWAPPGTNADGRAPLTVRLRAPGDPTEAETVPGALDFLLRGEEIKLCGGLDELRQGVAAHVVAWLTQLQTTRLQEFGRGLRDTAFPQATLQVALSGTARQVRGQIQLLGASAAEGAEALVLQWNDGELTWMLADPAELATRAAAVATTIVRRKVLSDLLARSELLRTYESALGVELAATPAPAAAGLPKSITFEVRLAIDPAAAGRPQPLGSGTASCRQVEQPVLDLDFAGIEDRLSRLLVGAQDKSREHLGDELQECVRAAKVRAKVVAPKRSKTPIGEITFEVRPKAGDSLTWKGTWNTGTWAYDLPAGWKNKLAAGLTPQPQPEPVKAPAAPAKEKAETRPRRRGLVFGAAALVVVGGVVGSYFALTSKKPVPPVPPPIQPNEAPVTVPPQQPVEPPQEPPREVVEKPAEKPVEKPSEPPTEPPHEEEVAQKSVEQPVEPPPPPPPPPVVDLIQSLRDAWRGRLDLSDPQGVATEALLKELIPAAAQGGESREPSAFLLATTQGRAVVSEVQKVSAERVSLKVQLELRAGAGPQAQTFVMVRAAETWAPDPGNTDALASLAQAARSRLLALVADAGTAMSAARNRGQLVDFYARAAAVEEVLGPLAGAAEVDAVHGLLRTVPPPWDKQAPALAQAGYQPDGSPDGQTGYPVRLKDRDGNVLLLVSVPPGDELWSHLRALGRAVKAGDPLKAAVDQADEERPWRMYYIDLGEWPVESYAQANQLARDRARTVPTRDEWFLAALKLRATGGAQGLFGGLWEWCDVPGEPNDGKHWLCGGSQVLLDRPGAPGSPLALPSAAGGLAAWWSWLTNPLVMQRRSGQFGDQLTGVRTVLRMPASAG